jgi:hypothetical protein
MHRDAETRIFSLAQPLDPGNRAAFIAAATEAVEKLGPNAYGDGVAHRLLAPLWRQFFRPLTVAEPPSSDRGGAERLDGLDPETRAPTKVKLEEAQRREVDALFRRGLSMGQVAITIMKAHPEETNKAIIKRLRLDPASVSHARTVLRYAPELARQVLKKRGITFAAAFREASLRKAALRP